MFYSEVLSVNEMPNVAVAEHIVAWPWQEMRITIFEGRRTILHVHYRRNWNIRYHCLKSDEAFNHTSLVKKALKFLYSIC
jgi:hypothetical protein